MKRLQNQRFLMTLNGRAKYIEMDPSDSSEKYAEVQKAFAHELNMSYKWTDIIMYRLYDDQHIGKIYYTEDYCEDGVVITLLTTNSISNEKVQKAKDELNSKRDIVSFKVVELDLMLNNIMVQTTDGESSLICTFGDMQRAKDLCNKANLDVQDIYEIKSEELQYYLIDGVAYDTDLTQISFSA